MGSSGNGKFGDYPKRTVGVGHSGGDSSNTSSDIVTNEISCPEKLERVMLEDVGTSEYYQNHNGVPCVGLSVRIRSEVYEGRLVVESVSDGEVIGNLPTEYNSTIFTCIESGIKYYGKVVFSSTEPIPAVMVTVNG